MHTAYFLLQMSNTRQFYLCRARYPESYSSREEFCDFCHSMGYINCNISNVLYKHCENSIQKVIAMHIHAIIGCIHYVFFRILGLPRYMKNLEMKEG